MLKFLFGWDQSKINQKILSDNEIPLVNTKLDSFEIDQKIIVSKCKTGNFYFGKYKNEKVLIKKVDITKDVLILDEFLFWKNKKNDQFYPELIAVSIKRNFAYIIFKNDIEYNLKSLLALKNKKLSIDNKVSIIRKLLSLINYFQQNQIIHRGLRTEIIGLDKENKIKILDYGELLDLNTVYENEIQEEFNKYIPPEYISDNTIHETFDIYSFGRILNDLFYIENVDNKENNEEINPLILNIIKRCLEENKDNRIKIKELNYNLELILNEYFFSVNKYSGIDLDNCNDKFLQEYPEINEYINFGTELENKLNQKISDLKENLDNKIKELKRDIYTKNDIIFTELDDINKNLIQKINNYTKSSKALIEEFYKKFFSNTICTQADQLSTAESDIYDALLKTVGMLKDISVLSRLINKEEYGCLKVNIENTKHEIDELLGKNSKEKEFDLIDKIYENQYNDFQKYCKLINEIKKTYKNINDLLEKNIEVINDNNKAYKISTIDLNGNLINKNSQYLKSMNDNIYAKIKENSNKIYIYNYFTKSISSHTIDNNIIFNLKCYSFFDKEENCLYVSGGCPHNNIQNIDNSFYKISINFVPKEIDKIMDNDLDNHNIFNFGDYKFEIKKLSPLLKERYFHCMIRSITKRNLFFNIGGKNTKSSEVYNIDTEEALQIQDLPVLCLNPTCFEINENIYLLGKSELNLDFLYYLTDEYKWNEMNFKINEGSLKMGMNIINHNNIFYLFGGYDNTNEYSCIYKFDFNEEIINIDYCQNLSLSHECSFNSNAILVERKDENEKMHDIIIMMDYNEEIDEIDLTSGKVINYKL